MHLSLVSSMSAEHGVKIAILGYLYVYSIILTVKLYKY
jgi:hypothetical protein